jgi:hypothetical protein
MKTPLKFVIVLAAIGLTGCGNLMVRGSATEDALCTAWGYSLPTRAKEDTIETQEEIQIANADFLNACEGYDFLLPEGA